MKRIINNKRYDTDTAREVGYWDNDRTPRDFSYCEETLYQKRTGEYFLYGCGGPMSKYATSTGNNSWSGDSKIIPLTFDAAMKWAQKNLSADDYEAEFGPVVEDESRTSVYVTIPSALAAKLRKAAAETGKTQSDIIADLLRSM